MLRIIKPAVLLTVVFTLGTGILFPACITLMAQSLFPKQARGSLVKYHGVVIGAAHIGQNFTSPCYFHSRPSAAGNGYDASDSGGTNLAPTSEKLIHGSPAAAGSPSFTGIAQLAVEYRKENDLAPSTPLPADAVTYSASGLDPDISPANARLQEARVAAASGLTMDQVKSAVALHTRNRTFGLLGEPRVNVLAVNLEIARLIAASHKVK